MLLVRARELSSKGLLRGVFRVLGLLVRFLARDTSILDGTETLVPRRAEATAPCLAQLYDKGIAEIDLAGAGRRRQDG